MDEMADDYDWYDPSLEETEEGTVICKYCKKQELTWELDDADGKGKERWVLLERSGLIHRCKSKPAGVTAFLDSKV